MAQITPGFSFAFLQECFVATLLILARDGEEDDAANSVDAQPFDRDNDDLDDYKLWVAFKEQADILRKEVEGTKAKSSQLTEWLKMPGPPSESAPCASAARSQQDHCRCCNSQEHASMREKLQRRVRKDETLPELPWQDTKRKWINSAAYELRL